MVGTHLHFVRKEGVTEKEASDATMRWAEARCGCFNARSMTVVDVKPEGELVVRADWLIYDLPDVPEGVMLRKVRLDLPDWGQARRGSHVTESARSEVGATADMCGLRIEIHACSLEAAHALLDIIIREEVS